MTSTTLLILCVILAAIVIALAIAFDDPEDE